MAIRPVFIPLKEVVGVQEKNIDFKWHSGFAVSQKQKSIKEMHEAAANYGYHSVLEVSSKSESNLGTSLSAFNLKFITKKKGKEFSVESAFQGSKVFKSGGPYIDLFYKEPKDAKRDPRLKTSGNLSHFIFFGVEFPSEPLTFFYDWLYINALNNSDLPVSELLIYDGFTDIEFNPNKSINCQAHAVALYVSLVRCNVLCDALESPEEFLRIAGTHYSGQKRQLKVQDKMI